MARNRPERGRRRGLKALGALLLCGALAGSAAPALAQKGGNTTITSRTASTASEFIAEAKILFDNNELSAAEDRLEKAIVAPTANDLNTTEQLDLWTYLAVIRLRLGRPEPAKEAFGQALKIKPTHEISRRLASTKVLQFFERFREEELRETRASIKHSPPAEQFGFGAALELSAYVVDRTDTVVKLNVYFRLKGTTDDYSSTSFTRDPADATHFKGVIPYLFGDQLQPFEVEYYLAAVTASDEWVATRGSVKAPMVFKVEGGRAPDLEPDQPRLVSRWWFWTGVGVLVAGAAAGGVYGYAATRPLPETGSALVVIR
ncbi:MAG: hypothetical protein P1V51_05875 [Deltaproteobacteria bacterium]|nr:hypothetical protein [Deltaproteobacteria bacterium]